MAITFPTPTQAAAQTPSNTFSPASTPLANTSNSFTYVYDGARGVWTSFGSIATGGLGTVTSVAAGDGLQTSLPANAPITTTGTLSVNTARVVVKTSDVGAAQLPAGLTSERPVGVIGMIRWNTTFNAPEVYTPTGWRTVSLL
jgi:hypothetical protein